VFDTLKRIQLQRRGLSCGKVRRKHGDNDLARVLRVSPWIRAVIFLSFLAGIFGLMIVSGTEDTLYGSRGFVSFIAAGAVFLIALIHFFVNHPRNFSNNARVLLIFGSVLLHVAAIWTIGPLVGANGWGNSGLFLVLPYAFAPMALTVLVGRNFGLFATVASSIFGGFVLPLADSLPYLVINLTCGFVAVLLSHHMRRRTGFLRTGFFCGLTAAVGCFAFGFLEIPRSTEGVIVWTALLWRVAVPVLVGMATSLALSSVLHLLERMFQATSTVSWVELADLNHPLLRRLSMEAPGTYHHSLMVANLSEAAAEAIGANVTMCRVAAYFHDVGKLNKPGYCIENISPGAPNPHDDLTPNMSAIVIMAHVKDGVDLALKHKLCDEIIDVIEQHHGTSLIYFFYRKALDKRAELEAQAEEGSIASDDVPEVDESGFRYSGPKPQFRESAIISLADAIESASRSLQKPTPQRVEQLVDDIIRGRVMDGQLDDSDLTMHELAVMRETFSKTLRSMLHSRISYPKDESEKQGEGEKEADRDSKESPKNRKAPASRKNKSNGKRVRSQSDGAKAATASVESSTG